MSTTGGKPLNEYQKFINEHVTKLKAEPGNADKKYMELRALANTEWRKDHPADETKAPRKPRTKKPNKDVASVAEGNDVAAPKEKKPKEKRKPSAYNMFISGALLELKAEFASKPASEKPDQKVMMKMAM
jgi:hypothetical protein